MPLPSLEEGWIRVENIWLSVDPYMRGRMNDVKSYVPSFQLGEVMEGGAVGKVVESRSPDFSPGDTVFHMHGWREMAAGPAGSFNKVPAMPAKTIKVGNLGLPGQRFLAVSWPRPKMRDTVFVSAGRAVGSAASRSPGEA